MIKIIDKEEEINSFLKKLAIRGNMDSGKYVETAKKIVEDVRTNKDLALIKYTNQFDCELIDQKSIKITKQEFLDAYNNIDDNLKETMKRAVKRIKEFHEKQKQNSWLDINENGETLGQKITPISIAGVYVPGGKAAYPSSVMMNIIPAVVAGVKRIVMATPPNKEGKIKQEVLAAAYLCGVSEGYKIGGAQAIAALAYGTESIPKVDKIVGPGNIYVALAKKEVFGNVGIDSIAGPSEILIIADKSAKPRNLAADLLGQAEHDEIASSVLITDDLDIALKTKEELILMYNQLSRKDIMEKSLENYSAIIVVKELSKAIEISDKIAPEHLELAVNDAFSLLNEIKNAGAIFMGHYTPEAIGDYLAGPNHVIPTNSTSRFFSPLSVDDFVKKTSLLHFSKSAFERLADDVVALAMSEGLEAHALSVKVRMEDK